MQGERQQFSAPRVGAELGQRERGQLPASVPHSHMGVPAPPAAISRGVLGGRGKFLGAEEPGWKEGRRNFLGWIQSSVSPGRGSGKLLHPAKRSHPNTPRGPGPQDGGENQVGKG